MTTELLITLTAIAVALSMIASYSDRAARAEAWRQIALERRWNQERRLNDD